MLLTVKQSLMVHGGKEGINHSRVQFHASGMLVERLHLALMQDFKCIYNVDGHLFIYLHV